ncbi:sensitivity to high expression protein she9 [Coemansia sp. Benny D115]|nr:sensitivity to high expression protein she9 [Coemansia sp. Benny D115]
MEGYTSESRSPGDDAPQIDGKDGREPVESVLQRILEPGHAKSIGVSPASDAVHKEHGEAEDMALVPLNVIYLPPPPWHTPLKPHRPAEKQLSTEQEEDGTADTTRASPAAAADGETVFGNGSGKWGAKDTADPRYVPEEHEGLVLRLLRRLTATRQRLEIKRPVVADKLASGRLLFESPNMLSRAVQSGRQKITQIRALPKDDDWVTWLSKALNQITGYNRISDLKAQVEASGAEFKQARERLEAIKSNHAQTVQERMANQREINGLLQRKHLWNEEDVARFTDLYRSEHQAEVLEMEADGKLKDAEGLVDRQYDRLVDAIRERYHEEQIWSDKIRRASTYGTWAVLFMNVLALLMAQAIFEPRKRRKIVDAVDDKLVAANDLQQERLDRMAKELMQRQAVQERAFGEVAAHLANVTLALGAISARQEAEMKALGSYLLEPAGDHHHQPVTSSQSPLQKGPSSAAGQGNGGSDILAALLMAGSQDGYSDSELDMYYNAARTAAAAAENGQRGKQESTDKSRAGFRSMLWKAARPRNKSTAAAAGTAAPDSEDSRSFTRAEAGQLAVETAAVTSLLAAAIAVLLNHLS